MALATMTRWSRSHNFCAVVLLLSPTLSSSFRSSSSSFSQTRFTSYSSRSPRKYSSPLETADPNYVSDNEVVSSNYKRGQPITFSVLRFGPMGASVSYRPEYQHPIRYRFVVLLSVRQQSQLWISSILAKSKNHFSLFACVSFFIGLCISG